VSLTQPPRAAAPVRRGVLLALSALIAYAGLACPGERQMTTAAKKEKPPKLNKSVKELKNGGLKDYLNPSGNVPGPKFKEDRVDFADSVANHQGWRGRHGMIWASIMPEEGSFLVAVDDPEFEDNRGIAVAKIELADSSAYDEDYTGLNKGEVGYWFVEKDGPNVKSYVVRASDGVITSRNKEAGMSFEVCHTLPTGMPAYRGPMAKWVDDRTCQRRLAPPVRPAPRQQGRLAAAAQVAETTTVIDSRSGWIPCPGGCCTGR
jgi:hypothetical protein